MKNNTINKSGLYVLVGTVFFSTIWACYFLLFQHSIDLKEVPQTKTTDLVKEEEESRPWISTEEMISKGSKVYQAQCAVCHGKSGLGDGTPGLNPSPRNLVEGQWTMGGSTKALFITLRDGISNSSMVSFKHISKLDRWALVHYIRSITKNKIKDDEKELETFGKEAI